MKVTSSQKIVIYPKIFSFHTIFFLFSLVFWLGIFIFALKHIHEKIYSDLDDYIRLIPIFALIVCTSVPQSIGRKVVINGNKITYFAYFFWQKSIFVTENTKIVTGLLKYPTIKSEWGWKISNRHGRERLWIPGFWCDKQKLNNELSRLIQKEIPLENKMIKI